MDKNQYFYRIALYTRKSGNVELVNAHENNRVFPLDEWLGTIVNLADGQHTVQDFINFITRQYPKGPPDNLAEEIENMMTHLVEIQAIRLFTQPVELPYYLSLPVEEQDAGKARELMVKDGYLQQRH